MGAGGGGGGGGGEMAIDDWSPESMERPPSSIVGRRRSNQNGPNIKKKITKMAMRRSCTGFLPSFSFKMLPYKKKGGRKKLGKTR